MKNHRNKSIKHSAAQTLEKLENEVWPEDGTSSYLIETCSALRKKPLPDFEVEDLRIMIGQNISLPILIPMAIKVLEQNILASGDFYPGDLLTVLLKSEKSYWEREPLNWNSVCTLFRQQQALLDASDTSRSIKRAWHDAFATFEKYHVC
ncbi:MAG: hypothetical protein J0M29_19525 [Chitinophagales bacterium]|nr:hypothetical protein [Chitinophagales bacterium]